MAQQTAVEWLLSELQIRLLKIKSEPDGIIREKMINSFLIDAEQAEAMEKEQIIKAHTRAYLIGEDNISIEIANERSEQYYNETFGGQGSPDTTTSPNTQNK